MTNEIELLQLIIREYKRSHRILGLSEELLVYLDTSVKQIFRYADKHGIPLENREKMCLISEKSADLMRGINQESEKSELGIFDLWEN